MTRRAAAAEETRRRIVDATRHLHSTRGIAATSWEDIAREAGVGVGTVYRHFPSPDELIPACGRAVMESVAPPEPEGAGAVFDGAGSAGERLDRLVATVFGMYERGAAELAAMQREPGAHPAVAEADRAFDATLAALVDAALEPVEATADDRRVVRAMIDLGTWQALHDQGLADAAAGIVREMIATRLSRGGA